MPPSNQSLAPNLFRWWQVSLELAGPKKHGPVLSSLHDARHQQAAASLRLALQARALGFAHPLPDRGFHQPSSPGSDCFGNLGRLPHRTAHFGQRIQLQGLPQGDLGITRRFPFDNRPKQLHHQPTGLRVELYVDPGQARIKLSPSGRDGRLDRLHHTTRRNTVDFPKGPQNLT